MKKILPLALRSRLKWLGYTVQDIASPSRSPRVPPKRHTFIGGGDFIKIGEAFFSTLKRHGLTPDMNVLDVGCGQGRMARPLIGFFDTGSYQGFDIDKRGIVWCQSEYVDVPNFQFHHADVFNKRYNKTGAVAAKEFRFPFEDNSFDLVFLTSVFTHMYAKDVEHYLSEIARVLKPKGPCLATWFLLDEHSRQSRHPVYNFKHGVDNVSSTTLAANPEAAIAFDLEFVQALYKKCGLNIGIIEQGTWARPDTGFDLQDLVIASK